MMHLFHFLPSENKRQLQISAIKVEKTVSEISGVNLRKVSWCWL